jgi:hypothetical protein
VTGEEGFIIFFFFYFPRNFSVGSEGLPSILLRSYVGELSLEIKNPGLEVEGHFISYYK